MHTAVQGCSSRGESNQRIGREARGRAEVRELRSHRAQKACVIEAASAHSRALEPRWRPVRGRPAWRGQLPRRTVGGRFTEGSGCGRDGALPESPARGTRANRQIIELTRARGGAIESSGSIGQTLSKVGGTRRASSGIWSVDRWRARQHAALRLGSGSWARRGLRPIPLRLTLARSG